MPILPVSSIIEDDRFREDYGEVDQLAESIKTYGLLQPIVVTRDLRLIAGGRRLQAHRLAGLSEIDVRFMDDLDLLTQKEIELEENIRRKSFTWQEEVKAKAEIHRIKQEKYGNPVKGHESDGWTLRDTAKALDTSLGSVATDIQLSDALEKFPELEQEKNKSRAFKQFKKIEEKAVLMEITRRKKARGQLTTVQFHHGNALQGITTVPDNSVHLHITDPPWGINIDTESQLGRKVQLEYSDEQQAALAVMRVAARELFRTLVPDGHMYFFFAITLKEPVLALLEKAGFIVDPIPCLWVKESAGSPSKGRKHPNQYETFFHCWKSDTARPLNNGHSNVFTYPRAPEAERIHSAQKPVPLLKELISCASNPGDLICDMFAGSGATLVAAITSERQAMGWELTESNYASALDWITRIKEGD